MGATPFSTVSVRTGKAKSEHNISALPPLATEYEIGPTVPEEI
jgi:hypothetical protein